MTRSAVLLLIFNRPAHALRTFEAIRAARPSRLLVHADGPRTLPGESRLCEQARQITERIDWPCEVRRIYRPTNLGCGRAVSGAVSQFFEWVEEGIVLEDDCTPEPLFFEFCDLMLDRYRHDDRIMHVAGSGVELDPSSRRSPSGVSLLPFPFIWGWATWRRAWQRYAFDLPDESTRKFFVRGCNRSTLERDYWTDKMTATYQGAIDTWDYQWVFALWRHGGLAVTPHFTLIKNHGTGTEGAHPTTHLINGFTPPAVLDRLPSLTESAPVPPPAAMSAINLRCFGLDGSSLTQRAVHWLRHRVWLQWLYHGLRRRFLQWFRLPSI